MKDAIFNVKIGEVEYVEEKEDIVNEPAHYKGYKGIETIDFIENVLTREEFIGYLRGNILKYHARANLKGNKEQDLKKAKAYTERLEKILEIEEVSTNGKSYL